MISDSKSEQKSEIPFWFLPQSVFNLGQLFRTSYTLFHYPFDHQSHLQNSSSSILKNKTIVVSTADNNFVLMDLEGDNDDDQGETDPNHMRDDPDKVKVEVIPEHNIHNVMVSPNKTRKKVMINNHVGLVMPIDDSANDNNDIAEQKSDDDEHDSKSDNSLGSLFLKQFEHSHPLLHALTKSATQQLNLLKQNSMQLTRFAQIQQWMADEKPRLEEELSVAKQCSMELEMRNQSYHKENEKLKEETSILEGKCHDYKATLECMKCEKDQLISEMSEMKYPKNENKDPINMDDSKRIIQVLKDTVVIPDDSVIVNYHNHIQEKMDLLSMRIDQCHKKTHFLQSNIQYTRKIALKQCRKLEMKLTMKSREVRQLIADKRRLLQQTAEQAEWYKKHIREMDKSYQKKILRLERS